MQLDLTNITISGIKSSLHPHPLTHHEFILQLDQSKIFTRIFQACSQSAVCSPILQSDSVILRFYHNLAQCDTSLNLAGRNALMDKMTSIFISQDEVYQELKYEFYVNFDVPTATGASPEVCDLYPKFFRLRRQVETSRIQLNKLSFDGLKSYQEALANYKAMESQIVVDNPLSCLSGPPGRSRCVFGQVVAQIEREISFAMSMLEIAPVVYDTVLNTLDPLSSSPFQARKSNLTPQLLDYTSSKQSTSAYRIQLQRQQLCIDVDFFSDIQYLRDGMASKCSRQ